MLVPKIAGSLPTEAIQHAFIRRGSKIICPMSQLCGMLKKLVLSEIAKLLVKFQIVPSFISRVRSMPVWYAAPLVVNEGNNFRDEGRIVLYGLSAE
jgi:hypothetical protein